MTSLEDLLPLVAFGMTGVPVLIAGWLYVASLWVTKIEQAEVMA